jgi:4-amino-4-deoxy-L-arabinose transferase-like glycosyltransferase
MIEILLLVFILITSVVLIRVNFLSAVVLALVLSTFLHKEIFSIYLWDLLPIRVLMGAFLLNSLYEFYKFNGLSLKFLKFLKDPLILLLVLYLLTKYISTINSLDIKTSLFINIFYTTIVSFIITLYLKLTSNELFEVYKKYIFVAFFVSLIPFIQIYLYFNHNYLFGAILNVAGLNVDFPTFRFTYEYFTEALKLVVMTRLGSIFWDVNHFGGFLAGLFIPTLAFILTSQKTEQKKYLLYFIAISVALFLTNSRSAWVLGFISLVVFGILVIYRKIGRKGVIYSIFGLSLLTSLLFSMYQDRDSLFREKVRSYLHYRMDSFDSHFLLLQGAANVFNKYPYIGGGTGSFFEHFKNSPTSNEFLKRDPAGLSSRVPAHSIWGEVLAESGFVGLFVFVGLLVLIFLIYIYSLYHTSDWRDYFLYSSFLATTIGFLIAGIFYSYNSEFFFILFLLPVLYVVKKEKIVYEEIFAFFKAKNIYLKFFIFLISLSLMLYGLGDNKLITYDEAIYAKVAKNILVNGDYLTLTWRNSSDLWFEKPPLYFIITAFFYSLLGISEFSTRIAVVIFSLIGLVYTYKLTKLIFSSSYAAIIAVFGLFLNTSYLYYSRIGMLDIILTAFITGSVYYFLKFEDSKKRINLVASGIFIGLAVLTKSIIGFLAFGIMLLYWIYTAFYLNKKDYKIWDLLIILLTSLLVSLPWHLHMYIVHGQNFIDTYIGYHLLDRFTSDKEAKSAPWDFYFIVLRNTMRVWFIALIPATLVLGYKIYKRQLDSKPVLLILASLLILVFFSVSSSKLKWYIMPVYPFLYAICGYFIFTVFNYLVRIKMKLIYLAFLLYLFVFLNLSYLYYVRNMVYTYDFNFRSANLLQINNALVGLERTYIDRVDTPVALFYNTRESVSFVSSKDLRGIIQDRLGDPESISIIVSPSRFERLKTEFPELKIVAENPDLVLATLNYILK